MSQSDENAAMLAAWVKLTADVGPLPGEQVVIEDGDLRRWALRTGLVKATLDETTVVFLGEGTDPQKVLRAAAHAVVCRARPFGATGERFVLSGSALRRLERALTAADRDANAKEEAEDFPAVSPDA